MTRPQYSVPPAAPPAWSSRRCPRPWPRAPVGQTRPAARTDRSFLAGRMKPPPVRHGARRRDRGRPAIRTRPARSRRGRPPALPRPARHRHSAASARPHHRRPDPRSRQPGRATVGRPAAVRQPARRQGPPRRRPAPVALWRRAVLLPRWPDAPTASQPASPSPKMKPALRRNIFGGPPACLGCRRFMASSATRSIEQ